MEYKFVPPEIIGERMKTKEKEQIFNVLPWQYAILRYDGHSFSKFTSGFQKPFDDHMKNAMQLTLIDIINKFNPTIGYVQSDEISIIFTPYYKNKEDWEKADKKSLHPFNGKRDKLISIIAGYTSVRFNYHINCLINSDPDIKTKYNPTFIEKIQNYEQHFDGRLSVFNSDEISEVLNYFVWRKNDCIRNCLSSYTRYHYGSKQLLHKKFDEMVQMLESTEHNFNNINPEYKFGVFAKKELYDKEIINPITNKPETITRTKTTINVIDIKATNEFEHLLQNKYW